MVGQLAGGLVGGARFFEAFVGHQPQLAHALAAPQPVALVVQFQAAAIPALGLVQVAQGGDVLVGVAEVEGDEWLRRACRRCAGTIGLASSYAATQSACLAHAEYCPTVLATPPASGWRCAAHRPACPAAAASAGAARWRSHSTRTRCKRSASAHCRASRASRTRYCGDQAPLLFAPGQRAVGGRVNQIRHDLIHQLLPLGAAAGVVVERPASPASC